MNNSERQQKIESYGCAYDVLVEALREFPETMWQFKPSPDDFSIHEIIVHITDSEANSYARCRKLIAEPGSTIMGYNESGWAAALRYHDQSTDDALDLFRALRRNTYKLIKDLPESVWSQTYYHPELGRAVTMDEWLDTYDRHIPDHIAQMRSVYSAWQQQNG